MTLLINYDVEMVIIWQLVSLTWYTITERFCYKLCGALCTIKLTPLPQVPPFESRKNHKTYN